MVGSAACAVAVILVFVPTVSVYVQRSLRIRIYGRVMLKPLIAVVVAIAVALLAEAALPSTPPDEAGALLRVTRAGVVTAVLAVAYLAVLVRLGFEAEERRLLEFLLGPLSKLKRKLRSVVR
jgi:hypothetical protein